MKGVRKKRRSPTPGGGADDVLCCCEYINQKGERSHLAACLCDCEDLDEACDRWITCKSLKPEVLGRAVEAASDRFRVPWIRGARKVDVGILPPLVLLPVSLYVAAFHVLLGVAVLGSLPVLVIWYYQLTHRRKGKTPLFLSLTLFSLGYMYYTFVREVFLKGHIGWGRLSAVTAGMLMTFLFLAKAKRNPGYLNKSATGGVPNGRYSGEKDFLIADKKWCDVCRVVRPPRSGHCRICGSCVLRLDHHCVWINNCIGSENHKSFILLLVLFMVTSVSGIAITLRALCRGQHLVSALFYCPGVYADYSTSFAFTCAWYCAIVAGGVAYLLLVQLLNISCNVTEREARTALRGKTGRCYLGGLVLDPGTYSRGLKQNWLHFLSLDGRSAANHLSSHIV